MRNMLMFWLALAVIAAHGGENFAYQAVLCGENGQPLCSVQKTVKICLYTQVSDGVVLWARENIPVLTDANGLINVELSDEIGQKVSGGPTDSLAVVFRRATLEGKAIYLGLTVEGSSGEIRPRQRMLMTPLAAIAREGARATGDFTIRGTATIKGTASFAAGSSARFNQNTTFGGAATFKQTPTFLNGLALGGGDLGSMPVGTVVMWWGDPNRPPDGWQICNGHTYNGNLTPNLVNKFPIGAGDKYQKGAQGGEEKVTLTVKEMPRHQHEFLGSQVENINDGGKHFPVKRATDASKGVKEGYYDFRKFDLTSVGGGEAHENMPPYRTLFYIMKVK